jgi:hypothetical protein
MCGKLGCTNGQPGFHVACLWLCRMVTANCPAEKFKALTPKP